MKDVVQVPNIEQYPEIINAAKTGRLVIFTGAGVSALVGLPLWSGFANKRLDYVFDKGLINFRVKNELSKLGDPKKILSICDTIVENAISNNDLKAKDIQEYQDFSMFKVGGNNKEKYKRIYEKLYLINAIYVTTNYDECLDELVEKRTTSVSSNLQEPTGAVMESNQFMNEVVYSDTDLIRSKLINGNVIHIHGSIKDKDSMLVTLVDYLNAYGNNREYQNLGPFLDRLFNKDYVVLFIGYGLEEFEILEYMLSKSNEPEQIKKHFMLFNTYKEDEKVVKHLNDYFSKFSVELIPYDMSVKGYDQLADIIDNWSSYLTRVTRNRDFINWMKVIDEELDNSFESFDFAKDTILELIADNESLEQYFFSRITESDSPLEWFYELNNKGYFKPGCNTRSD